MSIRLDEARIRLLNINGGIQPTVNNTYNLGTSSLKWANVYATKFVGALNGNADSATKLTSSAGSSTQPIYFSDGKPVAITGTINNNSASADRLLYKSNHAESASGTTGSSPAEGLLYTSGLFLTGTYNDSNTPVSYGNIINIAGSGTGQLLCEWQGSDNVAGHLYYRSHRDTSTGGWSPWITILDSSNYNSYSPTLTGSGASGTWGINISGLANRATYITDNTNAFYPGNSSSTLLVAKTNNITTWALERNGTHEQLTAHFYNSSGTWTSGNILLASNNYNSYALPLSGGTLTGLLTIATNNRYVVLGCQNESFAHYSTNSNSGHWFNTSVYVQGDIYCGSSYNQKVISSAGGYLNNQLISHSVNGGMWISGTHSAAFVVDTANSASPGSYYQGWYSGKTQSGAWSIGCLSGDESMYFVYGSDANFNSSTNTVATLRMDSSGVLFGAAWNDYAEFRESNEQIKPGRVVIENGDDTLSLSNQRLQPGANIVSDTYGFAIGETSRAQTPIAVSGRVLAYPYEPRDTFSAGDAVCSGPNGTVSKMTREEIVMYPERIIGTVSAIPDYEIWGTGNVPVNGRIWIKVV